MNKKYEKYIEYIVNDLEAPYFKNMKDNYGLSEKEYELVLNKLFDQPVTIKESVTIKDGGIYDNQGNEIYYEHSNGSWYKYEYDTNGNVIYFENSSGYIDDRR